MKLSRKEFLVTAVLTILVTFLSLVIQEPGCKQGQLCVPEFIGFGGWPFSFVLRYIGGIKWDFLALILDFIIYLIAIYFFWIFFRFIFLTLRQKLFPQIYKDKNLR